MVCADLLRWQQERNLDAVGAAKELGLPHVGADALRRLAAGFRPIGVKTLWPELAAVQLGAASTSDELQHLIRVIRERISRGLPLDAIRPAVARLVEDAGSLRRAGQKLAQAAGEPDGVNYWESTVRIIRALPSDFPVVAAKVAVDPLDALAKRLAAEVGKPGTKSARTPETARVLADVMRERSVSYVQLGKDLAGREGCKTNAWQMRIVAYIRQFPDAFAELPKRAGTGAKRTADPTAAQLADRPVAQATPADVTPATVRPSPAADPLKGIATLDGRPTMLLSGRLRVVVRATMEIGPESTLWADAVAAMNGDAAS